MSHVLNVVATCADRKSMPTDPALRLRAVQAPTIQARAAAWRAVLERHSDNPKLFVPAVELYQGVYWAQVRRLVAAAAARGYETRLWIASAGQGLLSSDTLVTSYAATFASGLEDSISAAGGRVGFEANRSWWSLLQGMRRGDGRGVHSLADLAGDVPSGSLLVFGSPAYVNALSCDLLRARETLDDRRRLVIVTSFSCLLDDRLRANVLENDARLSHVFEGTLVALHAQTAQHIVEHCEGEPLDAGAAKQHLSRLLAAQPPFSRPARRALSNDGVCEFIQKELRRDPSVRASPLLRALRNANWQCEQGRFKSLYESVVRGVG